MSGRLHFKEGGRGNEGLVLLHGIGATGAVWERVLEIVERTFQGQWFVPDLRGHGRSQIGGPYGYAVHATDIATMLHAKGCRRVTVVGHSFGGVVGTVLASGRFGVEVSQVFAISVKTEWTDDEIAKMQSLARRPKRSYASQIEAATQFLKAAGLSGLVDPGSSVAASGVIATRDMHEIAVDPGVYSAVGPRWQDIRQAATCPIHFCVGDRDPMVPVRSMMAVDPNTFVVANAGHNLHWEQPESVARWFLPGLRAW